MPRTKKITGGEKTEAVKTTKTEKEKIKKTEKEKPVWLKYTEKDIEAVVLKLAKQGLTSEKIGLVLRDSYGIPSTKILGKSVSEILKKHNIDKEAGLVNLRAKQEAIAKHLEKNKQDKKAKRALTIISGRIRKLEKYKKRKTR